MSFIYCVTVHNCSDCSSSWLTGKDTHQNSCHTSQGCVMHRLWSPAGSRSELKGPFMVADRSKDVACQQNQDQLKRRHRGGCCGCEQVTNISVCVAPAAICCKFSFRSSDLFLMLNLLCIRAPLC